MSFLANFAASVYRLLLVLYPKDFRCEFGDEMQDTFCYVIHNVNRHAYFKVLVLLLREICDLPGVLWREYIWSMKGKIMSQNASAFNALPVEERQLGSIGEAFLAGLPNLLMGLLFGLGKLSILNTLGTTQTLSIVFGVTLAGLVCTMLLLAWYRGWPLWSASWYLCGSWVVFVTLGLIINKLNLHESWRYTNAIFLGWIVLCICGYFLILSRSKLHGLLSVAFLFPMLSVLLLEFIPNPIEGWLAIGVGLLAAIAAGAIVRLGETNLGLGITLVFNLMVGLAWAYVREYQMLDLPPGIPIPTPQFGNFIDNLLLYSVFGLGVIALPFILGGLWNFGRRKLSR